MPTVFVWAVRRGLPGHRVADCSDVGRPEDVRPTAASFAAHSSSGQAMQSSLLTPVMSPIFSNRLYIVCRWIPNSPHALEILPPVSKQASSVRNNESWPSKTSPSISDCNVPAASRVRSMLSSRFGAASSRFATVPAAGGISRAANCSKPHSSSSMPTLDTARP